MLNLYYSFGLGLGNTGLGLGLEPVGLGLGLALMGLDPDLDSSLLDLTTALQ